MVIWIIGLSGSGKTTLARQIVKKIKKINKNVVHVDGDEIRKVFGNDLGYTPLDRKENAKRISLLCKTLSEQKINVVCSILSIFESSRAWNRKNINKYYEVFIDTPLKYLILRDSKKYYSKFKNKKIKNLVGMDIKFERPKKANFVIKNDISLKKFIKNSEIIFQKIKPKL